MARSEKKERNGNKNSDDILEKYRYGEWERLNTHMLSLFLTSHYTQREGRKVRDVSCTEAFQHNSAIPLFLSLQCSLFPLVSPCLLSGSELHIRAFVSLEKSCSSDSSRRISRVDTMETINRCSRHERC